MATAYRVVFNGVMTRHGRKPIGSIIMLEPWEEAIIHDYVSGTGDSESGGSDSNQSGDEGSESGGAEAPLLEVDVEVSL